MKRGRPPKYVLDWRQADEVRRRRREGQSWLTIARWLGWRLPFDRQAPHAVQSALRRAPKPPGAGMHGASRLSREAAERLAEADPVLSRRCAVCGRPNYRLVKNGEGLFETVAVGFTRLGGRWHCPDCAPKRARPDGPVCDAFAEPFRIGRIH